MTVDPNARICHYCGFSESIYSQATWWSWKKHRGLTGFMCPDCNNKYEAMTDEKIAQFILSLAIAAKLTLE